MAGIRSRSTSKPEKPPTRQNAQAWPPHRNRDASMLLPGRFHTTKTQSGQTSCDVLAVRRFWHNHRRRLPSRRLHGHSRPLWSLRVVRLLGTFLIVRCVRGAGAATLFCAALLVADSPHAARHSAAHATGAAPHATTPALAARASGA